MKIFRVFSFLIVLAELIGLNVLFAQVQFSVPKELQPIQFDHRTDFSSWNHYNRVEGLFVGMDATVVPFIKKKIALSGGAGYGISSRSPRYHLFGVANFGKDNLIEIGSGYFDHTAYNENWIIGEIENSFAAVLLHEDFMDYYRLKGWRGWVQLKLKNWLTLRGLFQSADYENLKTNTDWSLCPAKRKVFRFNPTVAEGRENLLRGSVIIDRLDNPIYPIKGFYFQAAGERSLAPAGDVFHGYTGIFATLRWFQPMVKNQRLSVRIRGSEVWNAADLSQHLIDFGGIGTLQAFRYKAFKNASAVLLGRLVYGFEGDIMNSSVFSWIPFSDMIELSLFAEAGKGWFPDVWTSAFGPSEVSIPFKYDAGVSISISGDLVRLDLGHPIGENKGQWRISMRILPRW